jgi:hypothetical protein
VADVTHTWQRYYLNDLVGFDAVTSNEIQQSSGILRDPPPIFAPIPARNSRPAFCNEMIFAFCFYKTCKFAVNYLQYFENLLPSGKIWRMPLEPFNLSFSVRSQFTNFVLLAHLTLVIK